jgi:hypothetical protein
MSELVQISVLLTGMVKCLAFVFFFILSYKYWRIRKSSASLLLMLGLTLYLPVSIILLVVYGSILLYALNIISTNLFPIFITYYDVLTTLGTTLVILGFSLGIRNIHALEKRNI